MQRLITSKKAHALAAIAKFTVAKNEQVITPDSAYREYEKVAKSRGLREAFIWIPTVLILVGVIVWNTQHPIIQEKAIFYEWSNSHQNFIRVLDEGEEYSKNQLVVEKSLISYLVKREKIDHATENVRFESVYAQSSNQVWAAYKMTYLENEDSLVNRKGFTREIEVPRTPNFVDSNIIQIEFITKDKQDGELIAKNTWIATITFKFIEMEVSFNKRYENVLGLKVTDYQISKRGENYGSK